MNDSMHNMMDHSEHVMSNMTGHEHHVHDHAAMMASSTASPMDPHAGHHGHHVGSLEDGLAGEHSMSMFFYTSCEATILFEQWHVSTWQGMLGSCIAVFIMAALYEGLKVAREQLLRRSMVNVRFSTVPVGVGANAENTNTLLTETHKTVGARMLSVCHGVQSLLHILQVVLSYFLMLIFMTYNTWLCIAVALGAGTGYFLFSWKRAIVVDVNEHCH